MNREDARHYLKSSGFSEEQIDTIEKAFTSADAVSRQAVLDCLTATKLKKFDFILRAREEIKKLPPVNSQETVTQFADRCRECGKQKSGRWIAYEVRLPDRTILNYRCSVCGRKLIGYSTETLSEAPFCHCGAKMVEPQAEKE